MRIHIVWDTVCGPSGMRNTDRTIFILITNKVVKVNYFAFAFIYF